ncbi:MAG: transposase, partial [Acidimicrobiia bacterium]|nr:transposase [Acidimicrobiia bacterium]
LLDLVGVGPQVASDLLIAAGSNPDRLKSEASFAALCGVSPVDASSGRQEHHRLNRGGDRQANAALYRIVIVRLRYHQPTIDYMERKLAEPRATRKGVIRCLKRYVAREIIGILRTPKQPTKKAA